MLFTQQWIYRHRSYLQAEIRALHQVDAGIKTSYHVINAGDESSYNIRIGLDLATPLTSKLGLVATDYDPAAHVQIGGCPLNVCIQLNLALHIFMAVQLALATT